MRSPQRAGRRRRSPQNPFHGIARVRQGRSKRCIAPKQESKYSVADLSKSVLLQLVVIVVVAVIVVATGGGTPATAAPPAKSPKPPWARL